jgi:hypothetical protein
MADTAVVIGLGIFIAVVLLVAACYLLLAAFADVFVVDAFDIESSHSSGAGQGEKQDAGTTAAAALRRQTARRSADLRSTVRHAADVSGVRAGDVGLVRAGSDQRSAADARDPSIGRDQVSAEDRRRWTQPVKPWGLP